MEGISAPNWRKSSYSGNNGGDCVEVGRAPGSVAVRDTKNRDGGVLAFSATAWRAFAATIKHETA
jgi:hypothetical protein